MIAHRGGEPETVAMHLLTVMEARSLRAGEEGLLPPLHTDSGWLCPHRGEQEKGPLRHGF